MNQLLVITASALAALAIFFVVLWLTDVLVRFFRSTEATVTEKEAADTTSRWQTFMVGLSHYVGPRLPESLRTDLEVKITRAGGLNGLTPDQLVLNAMFAFVGGLAVGLLVMLVTGWPPTVVLASVVLATLLPFMWLRDQVKRRHMEILADLPYHLDLLTLCVEAGLDFGAAVARMVEKGKPGALRDEFKTFLAQLRVGKTRAEALESMSDRVGLEALSTFLGTLIQADRMGTSLANILRLQAEQIRVERFQRAEKQAGEAPVKMLIPLVLFIFPTIWIILGAPLVFDWMFRGGP